MIWTPLGRCFDRFKFILKFVHVRFKISLARWHCLRILRCSCSRYTLRLYKVFWSSFSCSFTVVIRTHSLLASSKLLQRLWYRSIIEPTLVLMRSQSGWRSKDNICLVCILKHRPQLEVHHKPTQYLENWGQKVFFESIELFMAEITAGSTCWH